MVSGFCWLLLHEQTISVDRHRAKKSDMAYRGSLPISIPVVRDKTTWFIISSEYEKCDKAPEFLEDTRHSVYKFYFRLNFGRESITITTFVQSICIYPYIFTLIVFYCREDSPIL